MFNFKIIGSAIGLCAASTGVFANSCERAEVVLHNWTKVPLELIERSFDGISEASNIAPGIIAEPGGTKSAYFSPDERPGKPILGNVVFSSKLSDVEHPSVGFVRIKYNFQENYWSTCGDGFSAVDVKSTKFKTSVEPHYNGVTDVYVTE